MRKTPFNPDQMAFQFSFDAAPPQALEGGDQNTLSPFEFRFRQLLKTVFDDAAQRPADPIDRTEIAQRMSRKLGREISRSHLDQWSAMSTVQRRMQVDALRAVCEVTGDMRLMHYFAEAAGFKMLTREEAICAEYGARMLMKRLIEKDNRHTLSGVDEASLRRQLMQRFDGGPK